MASKPTPAKTPSVGKSLRARNRRSQSLDQRTPDDDITAGESTRVTEMSPEESRPPRGYSWAPFEAENFAALDSGVWSERKIQERAVEVHERILELAPWVNQDVFIPALARYLRAEARELLAHKRIVEISTEKGAEHVPEKLSKMATSNANSAAKAAESLGLTAMSYARLRATTGHAQATEATLADLAEQGRQTTGYIADAEIEATDE